MGGIGEMNGRWERDGYRGSIKRNGSEMEERTLSDGLFSEPNECRIIGSGEVDGYQGRMGGTSARNNQSERDGYRGSIKRDSSEMEDLIFPDGRILESIEVYEGMTMGSKADWERAAESSKRHRTSSIRSGAGRQDLYDLPSASRRGTFSQHQTPDLFGVRTKNSRVCKEERLQPS